MVTSDKYKKEPNEAQKALIGSLGAKQSEPAPEIEKTYMLSILKQLIQRYPQEAKQLIKELKD